MNTVDEILDYAISQEEAAAAFYADLARRAQQVGMREILMEFSAEEIRHKERLVRIKQGEQQLTPNQEVVDLSISDYLVEIETTANLSYQDALIVAMKREQAAFRLYTDMAEKVPDETLREVFTGLAREEAGHKLFFETRYDEHVFADN
jgi:rubrerythrin